MNRLCALASGIVSHCLNATRDERGLSYVFLMVTMPMLLGFTALVIEVGQVLEVRRHLQTVVDAAALAGAQELPYSTTDADLAARDYLDNNYGPFAALTEDKGVTVAFSTTYYPDDTITVSVVRSQRLVLIPLMEHLARLAERHSQDVAATATAIKGSLVEAECVVPIGLLDLTEGDPPEDEFGYVYGQELDLMRADEHDWGNWGYLDFGTGAEELKELIGERNCLADPVAEGDPVFTKTGTVAEAAAAFETRIGDDDHEFDYMFYSDGTWKNADHADCPRIILIPVVNTLDVHGHSDPVYIEGFVHFFVSDWKKTPASQAYVRGYFVRRVPVSGVGEAFHPNGIDVVRLIR